MNLGWSWKNDKARTCGPMSLFSMTWSKWGGKNGGPPDLSMVSLVGTVCPYSPGGDPVGNCHTHRKTV